MYLKITEINKFKGFNNSVCTLLQQSKSGLTSFIVAVSDLSIHLSLEKLTTNWLGVDVDNTFHSTFLTFGERHSGKSRKIQYATLHSRRSALLTGKWKFILSLKPWTQGILDD